MFAGLPTPSVTQESKPEIQLASGLTVSGGYQPLEKASIVPACKIEPKSAMLYLRSSFNLAYEEQLLEAGAVHPLNASQFANPIAIHPELAAVPANEIAALREKRGKFTYIDDREISHHPHIGSHVVTVAAVAVAIAEYLDLDKEATQRVVSLALLHDANKIADMLIQRCGELRLDLEKLGIRPGFEVYNLLVMSGIDTTGASVIANAGGNTGHSSLLRFLEGTREGKIQLRAGMLEQKIVHLADDMVSETSVLTTGERMVSSNFLEKYEYLWKSGIAVLDTVSPPMLLEAPVSAGLVGVYADLQALTSTAICAELLSMRGESVADADLKIKAIVGGILREKNLTAD